MLVRALDAARFAPSGGNRQGWRVVCVEDPALRRKLGELYLPAWRAYLRRLADGARARRPRRFDPLARAAHPARRRCTPARSPTCRCTWWSGVRLDDLAVTDAELPRQSIVGGASIYPFVQNLLLALRAEGLGAAMTTLLVPGRGGGPGAARDPRGDRARRPHRRRLPHRPVAAQLARRPVAEFAFADRWGEPLQQRRSCTAGGAGRPPPPGAGSRAACSSASSAESIE